MAASNSTYIGGLPRAGRDRYDADGVVVPERPANVSRPAQTVMFTTTALARSGGVQEYPFSDPPFWDFGNGPSGFRPTPSVHFRANGKALVAWVDGHVTSEPLADRPVGTNPYGGDASDSGLGWFGPDEHNGYWNSRRE